MNLRIVGTGIKPDSQITLQGIRHIKDSKKCLSLVSSVAFSDELKATQIEDIRALYIDGACDEENYLRITNKVLKELRASQDISLLVPGHPRVGVTLTQWLEKVAKEESINLLISEGISSFDTMINDLGRDPLEKGSVIIDANRLLLFDYPIIPELDHYIYHICSIGTALTHFKDPSIGNAIDLLRDKLIQTFPAEHRAVLISSSEVDGKLSFQREFMIKDLSSILSGVTFASSLYIPGTRPKKFNRLFLNKITDTKKEPRHV